MIERIPVKVLYAAHLPPCSSHLLVVLVQDIRMVATCYELALDLQCVAMHNARKAAMRYELTAEVFGRCLLSVKYLEY